MRLFKLAFSKLLLIYYSIRFNKKLLRGCQVNGFCKFNGREEFGENVNFNGIKIFGSGKVKFGNNFHSAAGLKILTSFHNYKGERIPYDHSVIIKDVEIEENVWIGLDVIILGGVKIGEGAIIQAGAVVVRNVPKYAICGGNPAVQFSSRDQTHYEKLKEEGLFL